MRALRKWLIIPLLIISLSIQVFPDINTRAATLSGTSFHTYQAESLKDIEKIVGQAMTNRETNIVIKYSGSTNKLLDIISGYISKTIHNDEYLNYSYRSVNMSYKAYGSNVTISLQFKYYESAEQNKYVEKAVQTIIGRIIDPGMNDHEKVKAVHDYVVSNLAYDTRLINNSPYPALTEGTTACNGYAMLIYKLLKQLGFEVRLISGVASSQSFDIQNHAWNMVKLDGKWYHLDATWDDPIPDESGRVLYNYYLLTNEEISKDHKWQTGGINGEEKPYPITSTSYFKELQAKISGTENSDRYRDLLNDLGLIYLLPEFTAKNLTELSQLISKQFNNYQKEFTIRYIDTRGDLKSNLRQIVYNSAVDQGVHSWSYGSVDYIRGTSPNDRLITVGDIVYSKIPPKQKVAATVKYPTSGFESIGSYENVQPNKVWTIQFTNEVEPNSISSDDIYVLDSSGKQLSSLNFSVNSRNQLLVANEKGYSRGQTYYLYVKDSIQDNSGKQLDKSVSIKFTIEN